MSIIFTIITILVVAFLTIVTIGLRDLISGTDYLGEWMRGDPSSIPDKMGVAEKFRLKIFVLWSVIVIVSLPFVLEKYESWKYGDYRFNYERSPEMLRIDSIAKLVDSIKLERAKTPFKGTIFAGIEFGDRVQIVEKKIRAYRHYFGNNIYVDSICYEFKDISCKYYKGKLYQLRIDFPGNPNELLELYEMKYGKTNGSEWVFLDARIDYGAMPRILCQRKTGYSDDYVYYLDDDGRTTDVPHYHNAYIVYESTAIIAEKEASEQHEIFLKDSIIKREILRRKKEAKKKSEKQLNYI